MKEKFTRWFFYLYIFLFAFGIFNTIIQSGSHLWQPTQIRQVELPKTSAMVEMKTPTHIGDTVKISIHSIDYYIPDDEKGRYEQVCIKDVTLILPSGYQTYFANDSEMCGFTTQSDISRPTRLLFREPWTVSVDYGSLGKTPLNLLTGFLGEFHEFAFSLLVHYELILPESSTQKSQVQEIFPYVRFLSLPNSIGWEVILDEITPKMSGAPGMIIRLSPSRFIQLILLINIYILFGFIFLALSLDRVGEFLQVAIAIFFGIFGLSQLFPDYSAPHSTFAMFILIIYLAFGLAFSRFAWKKIHKTGLSEKNKTVSTSIEEPPKPIEQEVVAHVNIHQEESSASIMLAGILAVIFMKFFGKK